MSTESMNESMTGRTTSMVGRTLTASGNRTAPARAWLNSYSSDGAAVEAERRRSNDPNRRLPQLHR